jgi:O-antigen ligase
VNRQRSPDIPPVDNPHNQYILTAVQLGVAGVLALLGIFGTQIYLAGQTKDGWERIRLAFPLFFMTIILTDSYLNTFNSAFLFSSFSAVFYKSRSIRQVETELSFSCVTPHSD